MRPSPDFRRELARRVEGYGPVAFCQYHGVLNALIEWVKEEALPNGPPIDARAMAAALAYAVSGAAVTCGKPEEIRTILLEVFDRAVEECIP